LEAWGIKANNHHVPVKYWSIRFAAEGGKANRPVFYWNIVVF
jgi:hypothetical protein